MYLFLISILIIIYAVIAWKNLRLAIFLFFACLPTYLLRLEILNVPTTFLEMMIGVLTVVWLIQIIRGTNNKDQKFLVSTGKWFLPFSLLLAAGIIGVIIAPDKITALGILKAYIVEPILFFVVVRTSLKWYNDGETALKFLGFGALTVAGFAIYQHLTNSAIPIPWDVENRTTSFFPYPNAIGLFLGPIAVLALKFIGSSVARKYYFLAWFWIIVFGTSVTAMFFSQTEAAWIAVPVTALIFGFLNKRTRPLSTLLIIGGIVTVCLLPNFQDKILLRDYSGGVRLKQWEETTAMLKDSWLFGAGLSGYQTALAPYHTHEEIEIFQYPHNIVLNIWSELGLLGLVAFIAFLWTAVWSIKKSWQQKSSQFWITAATTMTLVEMLIHGLVDVPFFKNDLAMLTAGLLAILAWSATGPYAHQDIGETTEE